jgi:hypothetical protein
VLEHPLLLQTQKETRDQGDIMAMKSMVLNKDKDLTTGETTTIMTQTIQETTMVKSEAEGQGASTEKERMTSIKLLHPETDQEGINTINKSQLRLKYRISKH